AGGRTSRRRRAPPDSRTRNQTTSGRRPGCADGRCSSHFTCLDLAGLFHHIINGAHVEEGGLGVLVHLAVHDGGKALDGVLERDIDAGDAGELFGHVGGLGEEALDLAGPADRFLVLLAQLVHAQDGDDVLQLAVLLEDLLHLAGHAVVLLAHDVGLEDAGGGLQRIDGGVDALLDDLAAQDGGGVQMGEGGGGGRVGQVVGRDVDRLHRRDRAVLGGGDALLQLAHLVGQGGLVAHGGGHPAHQGGDLAAGLDET